MFRLADVEPIVDKSFDRLVIKVHDRHFGEAGQLLFMLVTVSPTGNNDDIAGIFLLGSIVRRCLSGDACTSRITWWQPSGRV